MSTLADAIARLENTNSAYNNPGAISGTGDTGTSFGSGIGVYSTLEAGQSALDNQIERIYAGTSPMYPGGANMTLNQFGQVYAPNQNYGTKIASILGVPSSTPLSQIPSGVPNSSGGLLNSPFGTATKIATEAAMDQYGAVADVVGTVGSAATKTIFGVTLHDITVIIVGLILIAAGVFSFRQTQTIIETGAKVGRKIAEVAA